MFRNLSFYQQNRAMQKMKVVKYALLICLVSMPAMAANIETDKVLLRGVDKITGRMSTLEAKIGTSIRFGDLSVTPQKCITRTPEETPENAAYLDIVEKNAKGDIVPVFNGWMFSSNPALSAMEHPVYDIWVLSCVLKSPKTPSIVVKNDTYPLDETQPIGDEVIADEDNPALAEDDTNDMAASGRNQ